MNGSLRLWQSPEKVQVTGLQRLSLDQSSKKAPFILAITRFCRILYM